MIPFRKLQSRLSLSTRLYGYGVIIVSGSSFTRILPPPPSPLPLPLLLPFPVTDSRISGYVVNAR